MTDHMHWPRVAAAVFVLAALPAIAGAQTAPPTPINQGGPMTIEPIEQHFAFSPEYKVSELDGSTAQLIGAHAGVFVTKTILVGAGFYTLANGEDGRGLTYGGAVVGWQPWRSGRVGLSLRSLVGFGRGTTTEAVTFAARDRRGAIDTTRQGTRWLTSDLFVAEPQLDLLVGLTKHVSLDVGGGYRYANADRIGHHRFSGASGSIALRIGSSSE